jgi:hypothetical protein
VLEQCLRQRRVAVCLIDEAQHLKRLASGRRLLDQMDTLKSLAATTGTMHVLIGTYELLGLTNLSAQLSRRSVEVHFGRYRAAVDKDRVAFKSVLLTFQRHLPVSEEPDLVGLWERLYEGSLGCVGVLKSWLNRALAYAIAHEATTITLGHLDRQALPTRTLLNLAREITEGEAVLREDPKGRDQLRSLLGLPVPPKTQTRPRRTGRVARRPTRDPVAMGVGPNIDADGLAILPEWTLMPAPMPPRSRLYSLEPIGIGTPQTESLTSYISRLAAAHSVRVRDLVIGEWWRTSDTRPRLAAVMATCSIPSGVARRGH